MLMIGSVGHADCSSGDRSALFVSHINISIDYLF